MYGFDVCFLRSTAPSSTHHHHHHHIFPGKRGVVIVQLWNGSDPYKGQPLYDPWVTDLLERALATPGVRSIASVAPGGLGLCAVLYADREPWNAWGPHLATFGCQVGGRTQEGRWYEVGHGTHCVYATPVAAASQRPPCPPTLIQCQANAVAGSAYYKVLVGKILGYSDENIYGYVRVLGGGLTPQTIANVDTDLRRLSKAKPKLPWNREGSRGKKPAAAGGTPPASQGRGASSGVPR
ncbi:hypothetical protein TSOC_010301 [Tetrabaena socialis]|uniref:Uncharacterized protein n=1 Tax=Tetrabaena socialis TaxID=47790 RepID=A0A2J7ZTN1_9CHLO|nr:hypothetical protein TSOC_010301 [Tetrabaena socialis]|eukprot:PNH03624.1 hypothetical protein TSOC_010301 [Tetrabaena socialis]